MALTVETLYGWVKDLPIVDWHNHLDLQMLAEDKPLGSLYEVWVKPDPYKHRAMRICGVPERLITGDAPEAEKMAAWETTLPRLVGNPLFTWSRMEMDFLRAHPLETLTPMKLLELFKVAYASPCLAPNQLSDGRDARRPSGCADGQDARRPSGSTDGRDARRPRAVGPTGVSPVGNEVSPLGRRASCPSGVPPVTPSLGRRASCPSGDPSASEHAWSSASVHEFPCACADTSGHYSHSLSSGTSYRRKYPHIGQGSTLVYVTFRLADSLPESQLLTIEEQKREWLKSHPEPWDDVTRCEWQVKIHDKIDKWLDAGHGSCILADERCRRIVEEAIEYFDANGCDGRDARRPSDSADGQDARRTSDDADGQDARRPSARYRIHSYIVMPNHVHVLFELFDEADLPRIVHSWKSFSAKRLNALIGQTGKVWREEYYDRLVRNAEHYENVIAYFRQNEAAAAKLARMRKTEGACDGQDARRPSVSADGRDARRPSGILTVGGGDTPRIIPSLRMNAGEVVTLEQLERFQAVGCRVVDISVDDDARLEENFESLSVVAGFAAAHGWTMLLHLGALRETSDRLRQVAGPAGGFAGMRGAVDPSRVARFLNRLEGNGCDGQDARRTSDDADGQDARRPSGLPRTVLMTLNPEAHAQLAVLAGSFVEDGVPGKVQLGPAWWWCDHREGIFDVFEKNAAYGVLSTFVGMTTDSRSLLSFVRHDYFRRLLARWVAQKVSDGDFPADEALLRPLMENVCFRNAAERVALN